MGNLLAAKKTKKINGIVFDLDDTLYPQESFKRSGFIAVAQWLSDRYDFCASTIMAELESIMQQKGPSYPYMFNDLTDRLKMDKSTVAQMVQVFIDHEPKICCYPGVHSILARLRIRVKLGLLTDGRLRVQQKKIRALGLKTEIDEILCSEALGLEKPHPVLFEWFETRFGMRGSELIYIGDNPRKDFIGANSRGWMTVRILSGEFVNENCHAPYKAHIELASIHSVEKLMDN